MVAYCFVGSASDFVSCTEATNIRQVAPICELARRVVIWVGRLVVRCATLKTERLSLTCNGAAKGFSCNLAAAASRGRRNHAEVFALGGIGSLLGITLLSPPAFDGVSCSGRGSESMRRSICAALQPRRLWANLRPRTNGVISAATTASAIGESDPEKGRSSVTRRSTTEAGSGRTCSHA